MSQMRYQLCYGARRSRVKLFLLLITTGKDLNHLFIIFLTAVLCLCLDRANYSWTSIKYYDVFEGIYSWKQVYYKGKEFITEVNELF